jgi:hypothetical protein
MILVFSAYNGAYAASNSTILRSLTNASSLEVLLVPISNVSREEMHFRVGFLQPNTAEFQRHVDFNFIIIKDGKEVFRASNQTGQPNILLHSIPGTMDIPLNEPNNELVKKIFLLFGLSKFCCLTQLNEVLYNLLTR